MSIQICPNCEYKNNPVTVVCAKCGKALDDTTQHGEDLSFSQDFDTTIAVEDELLMTIETQIPEILSTTDSDDVSELDHLDTPIETANVSVKSDHNLEGAIISLFDLNGRRVINYKNTDASNLVDLSGLSVGEYILRVMSSEGGIYSTKILKR